MSGYLFIKATSMLCKEYLIVFHRYCDNCFDNVRLISVSLKKN